MEGNVIRIVCLSVVRHTATCKKSHFYLSLRSYMASWNYHVPAVHCQPLPCNHSTFRALVWVHLIFPHDFFCLASHITDIFIRGQTGPQKKNYVLFYQYHTLASIIFIGNSFSQKISHVTDRYRHARTLHTHSIHAIMNNNTVNPMERTLSHFSFFLPLALTKRTSHVSCSFLVTHTHTTTTHV